MPLVEPGTEVRTRLSARNGGDVAERYRLEIVGDAMVKIATRVT